MNWAFMLGVVFFIFFCLFVCLFVAVFFAVFATCVVSIYKANRLNTVRLTFPRVMLVGLSFTISSLWEIKVLNFSEHLIHRMLHLLKFLTSINFLLLFMTLVLKDCNCIYLFLYKIYKKLDPPFCFV